MDQPSQEDLKNMSPEELREYQKKNCLFCNIIIGKVNSKKVYEDDTCIGILDINPANPGHVVLMPKEHYAVLPMMPESEYAKMMIAAKRVSTALLRSVKAEGINMFIANGAVAGQKSPHAMIHLIPRKEGDNIIAFNLPENDIASEDQEKLHIIVKTQVNNMFGIDEQLPPIDVSKPSPVPKPVESENPPTPEPALPVPELTPPMPSPQPTPPPSTPAPTPTPAEKPKPQSDEDKRKADLDKISGLFK